MTSRAIDPRFSGDLYDGGEAVLAKAGVEAGYMLVARRLEIVGALDAVNAGTYDRPWQRAAAGLSWYLDAHNVKFQFMHRSSRHDHGIDSARSHATYIQAQLAF